MLGEKLVTKMWESIADKGIGSLLTPWQILREADARIEARRRELLALADAEKKAQEIRQGKLKLLEDGTVVSATRDEHTEKDHKLGIEELRERANSVRETDAIRGEINVSKSVLYAEEDLANDTQEPPDRDVDEDWLYRWKENASKVSAEELQQLWGRVLAGEVKSPGKYSFRTLEFLKNLSQDDARLIETLAQFNIGGCIARDEKTILEDNGINFGRLLYLQELGVVVGAEALGMTTNYKSDIGGSFQKVLISNAKALLVTHKDQEKTLSLRIYGLSSVGKEILSLGSFEANQEYLVSVGKRIVEKEFKVELGDWTQVDENHGRLSNAIEIRKEQA